MKQVLLAIVVITSAIITTSNAIFTIVYAQAPPNTGSCPPGQVPVLNNGKPVINPQTNSVQCTPIDAMGSLLGQ